MKFNYLFLFVLLSLCSCKKENMCDCFKSTGSETTEIREISGFKKIQLHNNVDLVITHGKDYHCKVTAGSQLIDMITTEIDDSTLTIKNKNKCNWVRSFKNKYTVEVSMPNLENIYYTGSGTISTTDTIHETVFVLDGWNCSGSINLMLNCGTTWLSLNTGTADMTISGFSAVSYLYNAASGPINAGRMETGYTFVDNFGTNECYVNVAKEITAAISLQGNIYYSGEPYLVNKNITGTGQLIKQ